MADNMGAIFSVEFEDYASVKKKLDILTSQIQTNSKISFAIDNNAIIKALTDINKLASQKIDISPNGDIRMLSTYKDELGQIIKLKQDLAKDTTSISIDSNITKQAQEQQRIAKETSNMWQQISQKQRQESQQEADEYNRIQREKYDSEQEFINASNALKQKASQRRIQEAQQEASIVNKTLEANYKEQQTAENQYKQAQKLIELEKEKLNIRLKSVELNRGDLVNKNYSNVIKNNISNLNGNTVDDVRNKTRLLNIELQKLDQNARAKGLAIGKTELQGFGDSLKSVTANLGLFFTSGMLLRSVFNELRTGLTDIKNLDDALRDLKRVADDVSDNTLNSFVNKANSMAIALGSSTEGVIKATTTFKQLGYTFEEASNYMAKNSIILSNVGDMSAEDSANSIVSILKAFKLEASDTTQVVDMLNEAGNKFAITTQQLAEGLRVGSASLAIANNDLAQSSALITTGTEVLRNPEQVANGLKTISMRLRGIADENGELVPEMQELVKSLSGVDITDKQTGDIRSTFDILNDMGKVWDKLGDKQQALLAENVAGKTRANVFASIMQNAEKLDEAYTKLQNSAGSAEEEQARYMDSISGKLNAFSESVKKIWIDSINTDAVKNIIDMGTTFVNIFDGVINTVGVLPTTITAVTGALTIFNEKFRESTTIFMNAIPLLNNMFNGLNSMTLNLQASSTQLKSQIATLKTYAQSYQQAGMSTKIMGTNLAMLQAKLAVTTVGLIATKVATIALQTAFSMGLSLAITGAISLIGKLGKELIGTGKSMSECKTQAESLQNVLSKENGDNDLISQYEKLNKSLEDGNLTEQERSEINNKIYDVKEKISNLDSDYKRILEDNTGSYEEQLNLMKGIYDLKLKDSSKDLDNEMMSQKKAERIKNQLDQNIQAIREYQENGTWMGTKESEDSMSKAFEKAKKNVKEYYTELSMYNSNVKLMEEANYSSGRSVLELSDDAKNLYNELYNVQGALNGAKRETEDLGNSTEMTKQQFESMADTISGSTNKIKLLQDVIEEFGKTGKISASLEDKIFASNDLEMIAMLGDKNTFLEKANGLLNQEIELREQNKKVIIEEAQNQVNSDNVKITSTQRILNDMAKMTGKTVDELGKQYGVDVSNFNSSQNPKANAMSNVLNDMAKMTGKTVSQLGKEYGIDVENFKNASQAKIDIFEKQSQFTKTKMDMLQNGFDPLLDKWEEKFNKNQNPYGWKPVVSSNYVPISSSYNPVSSNYSSGGSKSSKSEVADLELKIDRYYKLNNVIEGLNSTLGIYESKLEYATGKKYVDIINEELSIYKQQQQAIQNKVSEMKKEQAEQKRLLQQNGFIFDSIGNITNATQRLQQLQNSANSKSGNEKEKAKKQVENISEALKNYADLTFNSLPEMEKEWQNLSNKIKDTNKEMTNLVSEQEEKIYDLIKYKLEKLVDEETKALNNLKNKMDKMWSKEDYQDELDEKQNNLADLYAQMQEALRGGNTMLAENLRKEYEEAQKELNNLIKEQDRNDFTDKIDDKISSLDEALQEALKPENINKIIEKGLKTGYIQIGDEIINVQNAMNEMIKETTVGFQTAGNAMKEYIDSLKIAEEIYKNIQGINANLGITVDKNFGNKSRILTTPSQLSRVATNTNNNNNVTIEVNSPLVEVGSVSDVTKDEIVNLVDNKLDRLKDDIVDVIQHNT
ncbi:phage tail tape measure protein [Clostridium sp. 1001283B150210_160208_E6]|uniref:phage tail tape measure protein n=1 Tax=Clostridium sp. 1001283B150210_160208_E6 TaxID=2787129 RepID=UPI0018ABCA2C|nr:phage tail tape measure protein [Clostridium sp. 1001283B150210_160208_E6]